MRRVTGRLRTALAAVVCAILWGLGPVPAVSQTANRANFADAASSFYQLSRRERNELYLLLMATGDFNAMVSGQFGARLYDAIASFQQKSGLIPTGVPSADTLDRLHDLGGLIFNSWEFAFIDHPRAAASMVVPGAFGLSQAPTPRGLAFSNKAHTMSIDFAFFAEQEASLQDIFARLTQPAPDRRIDMKVIRPNFFAIAGGGQDLGSYSRYIQVLGGIAGFTITWNSNAFPNGSRVAVVLANELYPRHMTTDQAAAPDMFEANPADMMNATGTGDLKPNPNPGPSPESEQLKLAQQAEADQRAKAQAARAAAIDRLRQDRFDRIAGFARDLVSDASAFVKTKSGDPNLIDDLQQIANLNQALSRRDPDAAEAGVASLSATLKRDPDFVRFEAERLDARRRDAARALADAIADLKAQKDFLLDVVTQDPTGPNAAALLPLLRQSVSALSTPDLGRLQTLIGQIDIEIDRIGLRAAFVMSQKRQPPVVLQTDPVSQPVNDGQPGKKQDDDVGWSR